MLNYHRVDESSVAGTRTRNLVAFVLNEGPLIRLERIVEAAIISFPIDETPKNDHSIVVDHSRVFVESRGLIFFHSFGA